MTCLGTAGAEPLPAETRSLVEKGLTAYELERELALLNEQEKQLNAQIEQTARETEQKRRQADEQREKVGSLLRAYYAGDQLPPWLLLIASLSTWQDVLYFWEQAQMIAERNRRLMDDYVAGFRELQSLLKKLEEDRSQLLAVKEKYIEQKRQLEKTEAEINQALAAMADADSAEAEMREWTRKWEEIGLPLFRQVFSALSETMNSLPEWIGQNKDALTFKGMQYTLQLADSELNRFLHEKNESLAGFSFVFLDDKIVAGGKLDDVEISVTGRYELEEKPTNNIRFQIEELVFNQFKLPPSTIRSIEEEFDLGFYPQKLAPFLTATSVKTEAGKLIVQLKLSL
jgi:hypothetical protein